jgi:hypothetical protein
MHDLIYLSRGHVIEQDVMDRRHRAPLFEAGVYKRGSPHSITLFHRPQCLVRTRHPGDCSLTQAR